MDEVFSSSWLSVSCLAFIRMDHVLPKLDDGPEQLGEESAGKAQEGKETKGEEGVAPAQTIGCLGSLVVGEPAGSPELLCSQLLKPQTSRREKPRKVLRQSESISGFFCLFRNIQSLLTSSTLTANSTNSANAASLLQNPHSGAKLPVRREASDYVKSHCMMSLPL